METTLTFRATQFAALGDPSRLAIMDALTTGDHTPTQLRELTGLASNLLAFHLCVLANASLIFRHTSQGDKRRRYVTLHEHAPHTGKATVAVDAPVLFVCTQNQARSQLAAALWQWHTGSPAFSAGSDPAASPDLIAIEVATAAGLDASDWHTSGYSDVRTIPKLVISVCDRAFEAGVPFGQPSYHWSIADPAGKPRAAYQTTLRQLDQRMGRLLASSTLF